MKRSRTQINLIIIVLFAVLCVAGIEYLAVNIGQPVPLTHNYAVHAVFSDADGVPSAADVRVAGVNVGKVTEIGTDPSYPGETVATLQITDSTAIPLYSNGFARVMPKTLLGEKYVELTVGDANTGDAIQSGGFLPPAQTGKVVENDEIFNAFDAKTRQQQQQVLDALDQATFSRAGDIQSILPQLQQVVQGLDPIAHVYEQDQPQVDSIFVQLNTIMQTVADEHTQLAGLLANGNSVLSAVAAKDQALIGTLQNAAAFSTDFNNVMAQTIQQQQAAINKLQPALQSQNEFLNQVVAPQSYCGGQSCGISEIFTGSLLGNVNYPNVQLTVSSPPGELVALIWDSMFSQPGPSEPRALNLSINFHCDAINETIQDSQLQQLINTIAPGTPLPNPCTVLPGVTP